MIDTVEPGVHTAVGRIVVCSCGWMSEPMPSHAEMWQAFSKHLRETVPDPSAA